MTDVFVLVEAPGPTGLAPRDAALIDVAAGLGRVVAAVDAPAEQAAAASWPASVHAVVVPSSPPGGTADAPSDGTVPAVRAAGLVAAAVRAAGEAAVVVLAADGDGREAAGRLAVRLRAGVITDVVDVTASPDRPGRLRAHTQALGGGWDVWVDVDAPAVLVVAPTAVPGPAVEGPRAEAVPAVTAVGVDAAARAARVVARAPKPSTDRRDLADAAVVVAAGRGTDGDLSLVERLADLLGGAVGVSRAVVEAGWADRDQQVGQTGRQVSPQVYLAAGISGAIQHRSGMQTSKTIIAVNSDPEAPIFELADIGVVGDLFTVLPALAEEIERRREAASRASS